MIGIDPHKGSHTAVALDARETQLGQLRVRASAEQVDGLLRVGCVAGRERSWAIEGARGLGHLLAQQLIAAGERVLDVQPKLAARVRLLNTGQVNKNDPNDARSVAVAALRAHDVAELSPPRITAAVMRVWARRYRDLSRLRTQVAVPAARGAVRAGARRVRARKSLPDRRSGPRPTSSPMPRSAPAKLELAHELVADLQRLDAQRREAKTPHRPRRSPRPTTSITDIYGVGPIVAATVLGYVGDIRRFPTRDQFASYNGTAPIEVSSGNRKIYRLSRRGNRQLNHAIHMAAVSQIRYHGTDGRAYYDRKIAEGMTGKSALRALKRKISDALYARMIADARAPQRARTREGNRGTTLHPARPAHTPKHRLFGQATPGPATNSKTDDR